MTRFVTTKPERDVPHDYVFQAVGNAFRTRHLRLISEERGLDHWDYEEWRSRSYPPRQMGIYIDPVVLTAVKKLEKEKAQKKKNTADKSDDNLTTRIKEAIELVYPRVPEYDAQCIIDHVKGKVGRSKTGSYIRTSEEELDELVDEAANKRFIYAYADQEVADPEYPAASFWGDWEKPKGKKRKVTRNEPESSRKKKAKRSA